MSALQGKTVVFTGTLSMTRAVCKAKAEELGAKVTTSVSGKTDIVIGGSGNAAKLEEAQERGIETWTEQEFLDCVEEGSGKKKAKPARKAAKKPAPKGKKKRGDDDDDEEEEEDEKPKKKAARKGAAKPAPKKTAVKKKRGEDDEEEEEDEEVPKAKKARTAAPKPAPKPASPAPSPAGSPQGSPRRRPVDRMVPSRSDYSVFEDYTCKLNQTNIGGNNNKYYIIQVLQKASTYWSWNRWGRVGESGQTKLQSHGGNSASAVHAFEQKFKDKTRNTWAMRDSFTPVSGKYTLLDMDEEEGEGGGADSAPLGRLSKPQIEKGMGVLQEIEAAIQMGSGKGNAKCVELSSKFFSLIPTDFGRRVPEPIKTMDKLREKEELLKFWLRMGFEEVDKDESGLTPIAGVMDLPIPATLAAACAGVCAGHHISSSVGRGGALEKKQAGSPVRRMGAQLYGAIMLYTSNAIYQQLNKALRDENRQAVKKYFNYLRMLFEAMDTLPQKERTLWRGIPVDLYDQYKIGSTQTWWNVSSCTADVKVAKNFMQGCGGHCSLLTIKARTAADISEMSFYAHEKESLLAPGTQLKVESAKRVGKTTEITLVEVGRVVH